MSVYSCFTRTLFLWLKLEMQPDDLFRVFTSTVKSYTSSQNCIHLTPYCHVKLTFSLQPQWPAQPLVSVRCPTTQRGRTPARYHHRGPSQSPRPTIHGGRSLARCCLQVIILQPFSIANILHVFLNCCFMALRHLRAYRMLSCYLTCSDPQWQASLYGY